MHECYHLLPDEDYIFYADTAHVPYGTKTREEVCGYARDIVRDLIGRGVDAVAIACNTATSAAAAQLREEFDLPILGIEPAVKPAVLSEPLPGGADRVLVIATTLETRGEKLRSLIERLDADGIVDVQDLPGLVPLAEAEQYASPEADAYLADALRPYYESGRYKAVVLGCTHYNYFKPQLRKLFGPEVRLMDGNAGIGRHLARKLGKEPGCGSGTVGNAGPAGSAGVPDSLNPSDELVFASPEDMQERTHTQYLQSGVPVTDADTLARYMRYHNQLEKVRSI